MNDLLELDNCLLQAINYLIENWYKEDTGIVVCALIDGNKVVFSTSTRNNENWLHAEHNAYHKFINLYGKPTKNAAFVISLSPCMKNLKYRAEPACVELIKNTGITRIHFGVLDTLHASDISDYVDAGFIPSITQNAAAGMICKNLMGLFEKYDSRINTELLAIKTNLGSTFFTELLPSINSHD